MTAVPCALSSIYFENSIIPTYILFLLIIIVVPPWHSIGIAVAPHVIFCTIEGTQNLVANVICRIPTEGKTTIPVEEDMPCCHVEAQPSIYWYDLLGLENEVFKRLSFKNAVFASEASPPAVLTVDGFLDEE